MNGHGMEWDGKVVKRHLDRRWVDSVAKALFVTMEYRTLSGRRFWVDCLRKRVGLGLSLNGSENENYDEKNWSTCTVFS